MTITINNFAAQVKVGPVQASTNTAAISTPLTVEGTTWAKLQGAYQSWQVFFRQCRNIT